ncbi:hypothetical protein QFC22_005579 [Naganishia vaughanmartiniae]|uniref:Uncharacterized protein n=1 Tax=Naganishia vaughanmartiniae TaxID=1424756 RepID=A0ACC2WT79_9TREE|nr:hypothetical protein QFC22_005579 [Naganishia vaughanmartiniae]
MTFSEETSTTDGEDDDNGRAEEAQERDSEVIGLKEQEEEDIDAPPAFPMLDSAQRSQVPQQQPTIAASTPVPEMEFDVEPPSPSSSSSTLSPPRKTRQLNLPSTTSAPTSLQTPPTTTTKPNPLIKKRQKVALAPGCSPLDWARVKSSGDPSLRAGVGMPIRVTVEELKKVCFCHAVGRL